VGYEAQFKLEFHSGPFLSTDGSIVLWESLKNIGLVTAIAHPESFRQTAENLGLNVVSLSSKPDHHPFLAAEIDPIFEKVDQIAITEKDFWRQPDFWNGYKSKVIRVTQHADLPPKFLEIVEKFYAQYRD
jgi:tetraacyldisaccharide-1-P 4'-kinase